MYSFKKSVIVLVGILALGVVFAALQPLVGRGQGNNPAKRDTRRSFYLTKTSFHADQAKTACAEGYHMASLWEIFDTTNLKYDTVLGSTQDDSGFGPPSQALGWISTGRFASTIGTAGGGNCNAWTSVDNSHSGTAAGLNNDWTGEINPGMNIHPWTAFANPCDTNEPVWCTQN